jgi:hypothetical protein
MKFPGNGCDEAESDAGLVLGPGALVITFLAPVGAQVVQRGIIRPRILLFGGSWLSECHSSTTATSI